MASLSGLQGICLEAPHVGESTWILLVKTSELDLIHVRTLNVCSLLMADPRGFTTMRQLRPSRLLAQQVEPDFWYLSLAKM